MDPFEGWELLPNVRQLNSCFREHGPSPGLYNNLLESLGAGGFECPLDPGLALDPELALGLLEYCPDEDLFAWGLVWTEVCRSLSAEGGRESLRWRAVELIGRRPDRAEFFDWVGTRPAESPNWVVADFFGAAEAALAEDERLRFPARLTDPNRECYGFAGNDAYRTHGFLDARACPGEPHLEDFDPPERAAFVDLIPVGPLAWSLDAWRFEAIHDDFCDDWGDREGWDGWPACLYRRRAELLALAEESLRWRGPGGDLRRAWVGAVVRAAAR